MQKIRVSSTLTVYHDGQFWVGVYERIESNGLAACRMVFGTEPSGEEIQQLICRKWNTLHFCDPVGTESSTAPKLAGNPKRRQREVARDLKMRGPSTKAQQAISDEREYTAQQRKSEARKRREQIQHDRFEQRQEKRKQKHRGH